jgi:catechol 2,3-dioxygenase-like lactoylglutathione lyase family enzyme
MEDANPKTGSHHFAIRVDSVDEAVADLQAQGVEVHAVPHMVGAGKQAFLHDPSGNFIELNQPDSE